jgi:hypothetical protein
MCSMLLIRSAYDLPVALASQVILPSKVVSSRAGAAASRLR